MSGFDIIVRRREEAGLQRRSPSVTATLGLGPGDDGCLAEATIEQVSLGFGERN